MWDFLIDFVYWICVFRCAFCVLRIWLRVANMRVHYDARAVGTWG